MAATIDILPTLAYLAGAELPKNRIDGKNIWPLLSGASGAKSPHDAYYFYYGRQLQAVRSGRWKLHFPHSYHSLKGEPGSGGKPGPYIQKKTGLALYDLKNDIGETTNVADKFPQVVERLQAIGEQTREELGDVRRSGSGVRQPGRLWKR